MAFDGPCTSLSSSQGPTTSQDHTRGSQCHPHPHNDDMGGPLGGPPPTHPRTPTQHTGGSGGGARTWRTPIACTVASLVLRALAHFPSASLVVLVLLSCSRSVAANVAGRCYYFGPGMTIPGADYRRDYGLTQKQCAEVCKDDPCCMAFEFVDSECTLKSRSLNGTIVPKPGAFFGLCLDFENEDRERFWDHELGGTVAADKPLMNRDGCADFCASIENAIIYSWRTSDSRDMDAVTGHCKCMSVLHSIKLSFGSFAGFML